MISNRIFLFVYAALVVVPFITAFVSFRDGGNGIIGYEIIRVMRSCLFPTNGNGRYLAD